MRNARDRSRSWAAAIAGIVLSLACSGPSEPTALESRLQPARVGDDPVSLVHLFENNSSTLIAWRAAGVRERIVVHLDGHADLDWLPDATIARLAAATSDELAKLELHPYAMDGETFQRFAIWNFIYPAARLGIVKELYWVVPDGTMPDAAAARTLAREMVVRKMQMVRVEEALALRFEDGRIRGEVLGVPLTICELSALPAIEEPVLLDVDLDYFTTRSALTQHVTRHAWIGPTEVIRELQEKGIRTDLVTLSLSTIGGYLPPGERWIGHRLQTAFRAPATADGQLPLERGRMEAKADMAAGRHRDAVRRLEEVAQGWNEDASLWLDLAVAYQASGQSDRARQSRGRALQLDPLMEHAELFLADRLFLNGEYAEAGRLFEGYVRRFPRGPFTVYAMRRQAGCLTRTNRLRAAAALMQEVVRRAPEHGDSRLELGVLLRELGVTRAAIEQLSVARRILPDKSSYALALGTTLLLNGELEPGIEHLEQAIERQPCLTAARGNLSAAYLELGRLDDAANQIRSAISLQPDNPQIVRVADQLTRRGVPLGR